MRKHPKTRYGRRRGEGVKTSLRVAIKHGWKSSMNITPWDYLEGTREWANSCSFVERQHARRATRRELGAVA